MYYNVVTLIRGRVTKFDNYCFRLSGIAILMRCVAKSFIVDVLRAAHDGGSRAFKSLLTSASLGIMESQAGSFATAIGGAAAKLVLY